MPYFRECARHGVGVALILGVHIVLLAYSSLVQAPTVGEVGHMAAGVSHWSRDSFALFRVNPPLTRLVATLPVVMASPNEDWRRASEGLATRSEWMAGEDFLIANRDRAMRLFTMARWAGIPFSLLGACVCYSWARQLYGPTSGYLSMLLWCFFPSICAFAPMVCPDAGAAAVGVTAGYIFWRWLRRPNWRTAFAGGLALGLAELTKLTWVVLFLVWPLLWMIRKVRRSRLQAGPDSTPSDGGTAIQLLSILLTAIYVINLGYGFEGTFRKLGDFEFISETLAGPAIETGAAIPGRNRFDGTCLEGFPVLLPKHYVMGIDRQKWDFERGLPSYLHGEWADHGWWYYYLCAMAIKVPLGTWCLLALATGATIFARSYNASWYDEMVLLVPGLVILVFVSSQTGFSIHSRYVIPIFPFLFIWASKVARVFESRRVTRGRSLMAAATVAALTWSVGSSLWTYPHSLSYFNELAGGPRNGGEYLLDSNIDWGQDLLYLKEWLDKHNEVTLDGLAYWNSYSATVFGIRNCPYSRPGPSSAHTNGNCLSSAGHLGPSPGWYALSVNEIYGRDKKHRYFLHSKPIAMAGYSIYIYHITLEDANRVRRELGLPELPEDREQELERLPP